MVCSMLVGMDKSNRSIAAAHKQEHVKLEEAQQKIVTLEESHQQIEAELADTKEQLDKFIEPTECNIATAPLYNIPLSEELQQYTYDQCLYYGIEDYYEIALAIMWQESNYTTDVVSSTNDYGIMQINKCNHNELYDVLNIVDIMDPKDNIQSGIYILHNLVKRSDDVHQVLVSYNMGPTRCKQLRAEGIYSSKYSRGVMDKAELILTNNYK